VPPLCTLHRSWLTYLAVYFNVYALLLFAWAEATEVQGAEDLERVYNVQQVRWLCTRCIATYL
jgi:hypothetical protein